MRSAVRCGYCVLTSHYLSNIHRFIMQSMIGSVTERELGSECAAAAQAFVLWTLVSEGVELDRLDGGVFAILDTITEAVAKLDLAGEWGCILYPCIR